MKEIKDLLKAKILELLDGSAITPANWDNIKQLKSLPCSWYTARKIILDCDFYPHKNTFAKLLTFFNIPFVVKNGGIELVKTKQND